MDIMNKCISDHHYNDEWIDWYKQSLQRAYIVLVDDLVLKNLSTYKRLSNIDEAIKLK